MGLAKNNNTELTKSDDIKLVKFSIKLVKSDDTELKK